MKLLLGILLVGLSFAACNNAAETATDSTDNTEVKPADTTTISPTDTTLNRDTIK